MKENLVKKIDQNETKLVNINKKIENLVRERNNLEHKIKNQKTTLETMK